jgi:hypothetical protein
MDHVSARDTARLGAHNRRWRMRERARARHAAPARASDRYQTPEWLDRSFVLPLTSPDMSDVPTQPVRRHDDDPAPEPGLAPRLEASVPAASQAPFVRPPSEHIDFATVIRRSELCRQATRLHWLATGLAGLALVVFLLVPSTVAVATAAVFAAVAVGAFVVRLRLTRAPVPTVRR